MKNAALMLVRCCIQGQRPRKSAVWVFVVELTCDNDVGLFV